MQRAVPHAGLHQRTCHFVIADTYRHGPGGSALAHQPSTDLTHHRDHLLECLCLTPPLVS